MKIVCNNPTLILANSSGLFMRVLPVIRSFILIPSEGCKEPP